jgi:hypothetical protein
VKSTHLAAVGLGSLVFLAAWTQNTQSDWLKGIIYAGSGKVQLTNANGQLATQGAISATGNVSIGGTLGVSGAATLSSTLAVSGAETVGGALAVTGALSTASTLAVTSTSTFTGAATFSAPPVFASAETALTAHAGGTQAAALALSATKFIHVVSTVGTAADSVALPAPVLGTCHLVANEAAANALQLFAVTPATINARATATGVSVSAAKGTLCCASSTTDYACTGPN